MFNALADIDENVEDDPVQDAGVEGCRYGTLLPCHALPADDVYPGSGYRWRSRFRSAIITIVVAGIVGQVFTERRLFIQDGPVEWLTAGVINFRGIYWEVERDTPIAIPLFIFMGIMQRSKIAEDLLVTMAQLFGPMPGGLGISVVFVGALLAATTGIVGATVVAMGRLSCPPCCAISQSSHRHHLPRERSGHSAIHRADHRASCAAADQAQATCQSLYKEATRSRSLGSQRRLDECR